MLSLLATGHAADVMFRDDFKGQLGHGWSWVREHPSAWHVTSEGLQVRVEPGNMWGPANSARNVLVRALDEEAGDKLEISATVENHPTEQYEQVDLVWYYDDSHMVKLGQELVDGQLSIVMGLEEMDRTRTVAKIPLDSYKVQLRLLVEGNRIRGQFRNHAGPDWRQAGECDLPTAVTSKPKVSLHFYQGPAQAEHWAKVTEFTIRRLSE